MSGTVLDPGDWESRWGSRRKHKTKMNEQRAPGFLDLPAEWKRQTHKQIVTCNIAGFQHSCPPNAGEHNESLA